MVLLTYRSSLDLNSVKVDVPCKSKKLYISNISYDNEKLSLQVKGVLEQDYVLKISNHTGAIVKLLESFEGGVADYIHKNTKDFFNGKTFSKEKISNSIDRSWELDSEENLNINCYEGEGNEYKSFDFLNNEIEDVKGCDVQVVLDIDSIVFIKQMFKIHYKIRHAKQMKPKTKTDGKFIETIPGKEVSTELAEPIEPENSDHLDFF
jgi:hypothetical protein